MSKGCLTNFLAHVHPIDDDDDDGEEEEDEGPARCPTRIIYARQRVRKPSPLPAAKKKAMSEKAPKYCHTSYDVMNRQAETTHKIPGTPKN